MPYTRRNPLDVVVNDATDVEEFNTARERFEPDFGNRFTDFNGNKAGEIRPVQKWVSMSTCQCEVSG